MGKKGAKGFLKSVHKHAGPEEADDDETVPSTSAGVAMPSFKASAPPPPAPAAPAAAAPASSEKQGGGAASEGDSDEEGGGGQETRAKVVQRHKKETLAHKKVVQRSGKKSKDELLKLNADIEQRHARELQEFDDRERLAAVAAAAAAAEAAAAAAPAPPAAAAAAPTPAAAGGVAAWAASQLPSGMQGLAVAADDDQDKGKQSKGHKRRQKLAQQEADREARIAEEQAALGPSAAAVEAVQLASLLQPMGLAVRDIRADGHCLYRSLEDQLKQHPRSTSTSAASTSGASGSSSSAAAPSGARDYLGLRRLAAAHIRAHPADFLPFLDESDGPSAGEGGGAPGGGGGGGGGADMAQLVAYCRDLEETAAWGGELELKALAQALRCQIRVYSVDLPPVLMGEEEAAAPGAAGAAPPPLQLCYLRHAYGLGEHYNSVAPLAQGQEGAPAAAAAAAATVVEAAPGVFLPVPVPC